MCGICGTVGFGDLHTVRRMAATLTHRGPDADGSAFFPEERVGLAFRRLAIIDLSPAAGQPMSTEDEGICLVYNGEIYNHRELRAELERRGHRFRSHSDTEVLLRLYAEHGTAALPLLNGMFAFGLLDRRQRKLVLARDPMGIKPLYYHQGNGRFTFASEIKAILASGAVSAEIDPQALYDYFTYLYVPCPQTIFSGIRQLHPGHALELDLTSLSVNVWRYCDQAGEGDGGSLRELLADAVSRQMIADVPLGVFLSGGIDSTVVTGLMAQSSPRRVKTFTVVFEDPELSFYDERDRARAVADRFGTEHHEIPVRAGDPVAMLELIRFFDQPFGNPTFYLMHLISRAARPEVTVALSGTGGDELFAGYPRYRAMALGRRMEWVPPAVLRGVRGVLGLLSDDYRRMTLRRMREFAEGWDKDAATRFMNWTYFFTEDQKSVLLAGLGKGLRPSDRIVRERLEGSTLPDPGNRFLEADLRTFLVDNILEYTDKMSMAVGLEVRVPYLDVRVVEHALGIPFRDKLRGRTAKAVLKETFADLIPAEVARGPKKGFNAPLAVWMRDRLDGYFDIHMTEDAVRDAGLLDWGYIQRLRSEHRNGKRDNGHELFSILVFDAWHRMYL